MAMCVHCVFIMKRCTPFFFMEFFLGGAELGMCLLTIGLPAIMV